MEIEDKNNKENPKNSKPILKATKSEYRIAVKTPIHSNNLLEFKKNYFFLIFIAFSFPRFSPISNSTGIPSSKVSIPAASKAET